MTQLPAKRDVLDHADEHLAIAARDAKAYQILHESGASQAMMNAGAAQLAEVFCRISAFAQFEALRRIDESKGYRFISHGANMHAMPDSARVRAQNAPCRNIREACQALGFAVDRYYLLQREVKEFGAVRARELEESGLGKPIRRFLVTAPKDVQKAALDLLGEHNGDRKAAARAVAELVSALLDEERGKREAAEAAAELALAEHGATDRKLTKAEERLEQTQAHLADATAKASELERELKTPAFIRDDKKIAKELEGIRLALYALVGNIEGVCDALAVRVQEGKPAEELNLDALFLLELTLNLAGTTFGKYLRAFDPGQNYTAFWATHNLFTTPGTEADLADFQNTMSQLAGRKGAK